MNWKKKITKKQLKHIRETTDRCTLAEFKSNRAFHWKERIAGRGESCYECRMIALRLGIE